LFRTGGLTTIGGFEGRSGRLSQQARRVAVVTDSAASLPEGIPEELGISVVPIYLRFGDRTNPDDRGAGDFYERLRSSSEPVSTASPSPGDFRTAFEATGASEVVCVTIASSVSGIHRSASIGAEDASPHVEVVDSGAASMAQGFVAMEAARTAARGSNLAEVAQRAREVADRVQLVAAIETFEFLRRSGRVNRLASYAGTMLNIKPVFRMGGGSIDAVGRPRTRRRALEVLEQEARADIARRPVHLAAVHADAEEDAHELLARVSEGLEVTESHIASFTPAMGAHTGPGVVGLAWFCD
jgi:DegV family protein with EDD domain